MLTYFTFSTKNKQEKTRREASMYENDILYVHKWYKKGNGE